MDFVLKVWFVTEYINIRDKFQSLFYWILFLRSILSEENNLIDVFQSLFYWILFLRTEVWTKFCCRISWVSILVLLDFVLKVFSVMLIPSFAIVSILVLLDFVLKAYTKF